MVEGGVLKGTPGFSHISSGQTLNHLHSLPCINTIHSPYLYPPPSIDSAYDLYIWTRPVIPTFYSTPSFVENLLFERPGHNLRLSQLSRGLILLSGNKYKYK